MICIFRFSFRTGFVLKLPGEVCLFGKNNKKLVFIYVPSLMLIRFLLLLSLSASSSAPPPGGLTEPSAEQHQTTSSSFSTAPSPLFASPPPLTFVPTHQPHSSNSPGYQQTTHAWKLPTPQSAPIPSLCALTCTPPIPVLIPKEWYRSQRKKTER